MISTKSWGFQFNQFDKTYQHSNKIITKDSSVSAFVTSKALIICVHPLLSHYISQQKRQNLTWSNFCLSHNHEAVSMHVS